MTWFAQGAGVGPLELSMVSAAVAVMVGIGWALGRDEQTTSGFFLGDRRVPPWAVVLSFVATEISAMTVIGVPAVAYRENWQYLQFYIGSAAARLAIAFLFIPAFYEFNCTTIYEYLLHRFGPLTQYAGTAFFFVTRLFGSGVRLMAASVAVSVLLGWHIVPVIGLFTLVSVLYIGSGGVRAVVWTNVFQAATFVAAGAATVAFLLHRIDGGLGEAVRAASAAGRLSLWNLGPPAGSPGGWGAFFSAPNLLWAAILNGFFQNMAAFGTDHDLMQRLLTVKTRRLSQKAMLWTTLVSFVVIVLFLAVGTGLFVFYQQHAELPLPESLDRIYPHFVSQAMPPLLRGLVLTAIFMASIDSPLASLSASFVTDIYRPLVRGDASDAHYVRVSRVSIVIFGVLLAFIAYFFSSFDGMLWLAIKIGGVTFGSLLGVFLLGLLTRRRANRANAAAMTLMAMLNLALLVMSERGLITLGWSWLVVLGTLGTMGLAAALAPVLDKPAPA